MRNCFCFYSNKDCLYFPCHEGVDEENFNCMFCYCPLYALGKACGGNFTYTKEGIKDCSNCTVPHRPENYAYINDQYKKIMDVVKREDERSGK